MILATSGDVSRFRDYRKYTAYAGYFAGLDKSQTIDRTKMSKRGNRGRRRVLFEIAAPLVWFDPGDNPYRSRYARKMTEGRPWRKAMPFVCAALARHIYHCLKFRERYDVEKTFQHSPSVPVSQRMLMDLRQQFDARFQLMDAHLTPQDAELIPYVDASFTPAWR